MHETPDNEGLDRRDFMIASGASVGAAAALAMSAGAVNAQTSAQPLPLSTAGTTYTGDGRCQTN
jgi:hypothetical protein